MLPPSTPVVLSPNGRRSGSINKGELPTTIVGGTVEQKRGRSRRIRRLEAASGETATDALVERPAVVPEAVRVVRSLYRRFEKVLVEASVAYRHGRTIVESHLRGERDQTSAIKFAMRGKR